MEFWTLIHKDGTGQVVPYDSNPTSDDEGLLVYRSEKAAQLAAEHQNEMYDLDCEPILLEEFAKRFGSR